MELRSIEAIAKALNDAHVQYIVVGGVAVNAHGFVRMTRDIDLVIQLNPQNITAALRALLLIGYRIAIPASIEEFADPKTRKQWQQEKNMIVLKLWSDQHNRTPIDIFIYEPFSFEEEISDIIPLEISEGIRIPIVSLKTLLLMKQEAGRSQDFIDIQELTRIS